MKRNILNIVMLLVMIYVMNYQYSGNMMHEIVGVAALVLFILHNYWNRRWYGSIIKGRQTAVRLLGTGINLLLLASMLTAMVSGIMISCSVFSFMHLRFGLTVYEIHSVSAYLSFILIALHLGMHWEGLLLRIRRWLGLNGKMSGSILRIMCLVGAGYGVYASFEYHIGSKLLMVHGFGMWGSVVSLWDFSLAYSAIIVLYAGLAHYLVCFLRKINNG